MLERRDTGEPMHVHVRICQRSISSRGDYSRAESISFRACSGAATNRERRLFESGVYSVIYGSLRAIVPGEVAERLPLCACWRCEGLAR